MFDSNSNDTIRQQLYNKYKQTYYDHIHSSIGMLCFMLLFAAAFIFFAFSSTNFWAQLALFTIALALPLMPLKSLLGAISNLKSNQIILEEDHLIHTEETLVEGEIVHWANFESHQKIPLHGAVLQQLINRSNTPVYIVKTGRTEELLEVITLDGKDIVKTK